MAVLFSKGQPWTTDMRDKLKIAFAAGLDLEELCRKFGRTPNGITSQLEAMGLVVAMGRNRHYHKVDPDPWITSYDVMNHLTKRLEEEDVKSRGFQE